MSGGTSGRSPANPLGRENLGRNTGFSRLSQEIPVCRRREQDGKPCALLFGVLHLP